MGKYVEIDAKNVKKSKSVKNFIYVCIYSSSY